MRLPLSSPSPSTRRALGIAFFLAALTPALLLAVDAFTGALGANPVEQITRRTGRWALHLLLVTLTLTPLRRLSGWNWLARLRRMSGLFCFFYACLHLSTYLVLDAFFDPGYILADIADRRFMTAGFATFLTLVPLAITSTDRMQRRLGGRRWARLHRLAYVAACTALVHFLWLVKTGYDRPVLYLAIGAGLAVLRAPPIARRLGHWRAPPAVAAAGTRG